MDTLTPETSAKSYLVRLCPVDQVYPLTDGTSIVIAKGMRLGRQEDAHEFLRYIIDGCQKVCLQRFLPKERPKHAENTWVHRIFGGKTRSRVSCKRCGHNSDTFETCLDLSLDLGQGVTTVEEAFTAFVKPERLGGKGDDRYKCEK